MDNFGLQRAEPECPGELSGRHPTPRARLQQKQAILQNELNAVNEALAALDANPNIEQVMTLVQRAL